MKCEMCPNDTPQPPIRLTRPDGAPIAGNEAPAFCSPECRDELDRIHELKAKEDRAWMNAGDDSWAWGRP